MVVGVWSVDQFPSGVRPSHVWYVCYGSNLDAGRFGCYLEGGLAPGRASPNPGCADRSPPTGDKAVSVPASLYFSGHTASWGAGGAPAFVAADDVSRRALARAYRITAGQFADIVAQENGLSSFALDWEALLDEGRLRCDLPTYDMLRLVGFDRDPCVTFTSSRSPDHFAAPAPEYLRTIAAGLAVSHRLSPGRIGDYLLAAPGIADAYTRDDLIELATPLHHIG
jgi:hypothetical protein